MSSTKPKVSIVTISYNQEDYIGQALQSFVEQKTDFDFEVIVADDASKDNTQTIVREYEKKYPNIFNNILRKNNLGAFLNFKDALTYAKGDYIALCEGDDFWTDPTKLQRQVDFMEKNDEYSLVFHPVKVFFEDNSQPDSTYPVEKNNFTTTELLSRNFIQTNSVMYRARSSQEYGELLTNIMPGDWYLHLFHAQFGKIGFIDREMSAYRRHSEGIWWSAVANIERHWSENAGLYARLYDEMLVMYEQPQYRKIIQNNIRKLAQTIYEMKNESFKDDAINNIHSNDEKRLIDIIKYYNYIDKKTKMEIEKLRSVVDDKDIEITTLRQELDLIRNSATWKARGRVVGPIKKIIKR